MENRNIPFILVKPLLVNLICNVDLLKAVRLGFTNRCKSVFDLVTQRAALFGKESYYRRVWIFSRVNSARDTRKISILISLASKSCRFWTPYKGSNSLQRHVYRKQYREDFEKLCRHGTRFKVIQLFSTLSPALDAK